MSVVDERITLIYGAARQGKVAVTLMTLLYIYIYII